MVKPDTLNVVDIWKEISNIGSTTFVNVSDGTERTVPWGHLQWFSLVSAVAFPLVAVTWVIIFLTHKF